MVFDAVDALKRLVDNLRVSLETGEPLRTVDGLPQLIATIRDVASGKVIENRKKTTEPEITPGMKLGEILIAAGKTTDEVIRKTKSRARRSR